jgi:hypothetical protein
VIQALIDRYYSAAYEKIWARHESGLIGAETALQQAQTAWERAAARILRETGYSI